MILIDILVFDREKNIVRKGDSAGYQNFVLFSNETRECVFNCLPNDTIVEVTKLKAFADDMLNMAKMMISLFDRVENTVGKGENACYQHFFIFPTAFSKPFFFRVVKSRNCVGKI